MREATDLGISAGVRRELSGRRIDLIKIKFPVKAGTVTLQGELCFVGIDKTPDETAVELKFIESSLKSLPGVKEVIFELTDWRRSETGAWESTSSPAFSSSGTATVIEGDGIVCPECDNVIRFCPCCGKPLAGAGKSAAGRPRKQVLPIRPIIKKKSPVIASPVIRTPAPTMPIAAGPVSPAVTTIKPVTTNFPTTPVKPISQPNPVVIPKPAFIKPAVPTVPATPIIPTTPVSKPSFVPPVVNTPAPATKPFTPFPAPTKIPAAIPTIAIIPDGADNGNDNLDNLDSDSNIPDVPDFGAFSISADEMKTQKPVEPVKHDNIDKPAKPAPDSNDFNFDDLLSSSASDNALPENDVPSETPAFDFGSLGDLDAKPATPEDDTPLPPMRPAQPKTPKVATAPVTPVAPTGFEDDDTPLPPMRKQAPPAKKNKDPFAALFSETELNFGLPGENSDPSKDPFGNIDLELDVLEVFPGKKPPAPAKPAPADDNPFNLDNIIDLDSPVEDKSPSKKKGTKDPFDLDDFDISKFKI